MIDSVRLIRPEFLDQPEALWNLRLMTALDSMRSAVRWFDRIEKERSPQSRSDQLLALVTMCGWAWAAIELVRKAKKECWLRKETFETDEACLSTWDEITSPTPSKRLQRLTRVRNHCFGHFDKGQAKAFLEEYKNRTADEIPPVLETSGSGKFLETMYPWAYQAIATSLSPLPFDLKQTRKSIREIRQLIVSILVLLNTAIRSFTNSEDFEIVRQTESWFETST